MGSSLRTAGAVFKNGSGIVPGNKLRTVINDIISGYKRKGLKVPQAFDVSGMTAGALIE